MLSLGDSLASSQSQETASPTAAPVESQDVATTCKCPDTELSMPRRQTPKRPSQNRPRRTIKLSVHFEDYVYVLSRGASIILVIIINYSLAQVP